jgi:hypothetical protein
MLLFWCPRNRIIHPWSLTSFLGPATSHPASFFFSPFLKKDRKYENGRGQIVNRLLVPQGHKPPWRTMALIAHTPLTMMTGNLSHIKKLCTIHLVSPCSLSRKSAQKMD